jgi:hypothetical protein
MPDVEETPDALAINLLDTLAHSQGLGGPVPSPPC